jgi:tRNA (guanine26-N2/guanine27-N2)-dimethyltransferase
LKSIKENITSIWVPDVDKNLHHSGPGTANVPVFYNPAMQFNRDVSILVIDRFLQEKEKTRVAGGKVTLLDGLAGTGIRMVRMGNELSSIKSGEISLVINDYNPIANKLILKNIEENDLSNASAPNKELNLLLLKNRFDYVDIDPFGSPIKFLDAGVRRLRNHGILAVTATDTATLFGRYPKTCKRRYDAWPCRTGFSHELGLRILVGCCIRTAAKYNIGLQPLLAHATDHYYRLYLRVVEGRSTADESTNEIGYVLQPRSSNRYKVIKQRELFTSSKQLAELTNDFKLKNKTDLNFAGPLWVGQLFDKEFLGGLKIQSIKFDDKTQLEKNLTLWLGEAEAPVGFYDVNKLSSEFKLSAPPMKKIITAVQDQGWQITRTHFKPNGFKTDAPFDELIDIIQNL